MSQEYDEKIVKRYPGTLRALAWPDKGNRLRFRRLSLMTNINLAQAHNQSESQPSPTAGTSQGALDVVKDEQAGIRRL